MLQRIVKMLNLWRRGCLPPLVFPFPFSPLPPLQFLFHSRFLSSPFLSLPVFCAVFPLPFCLPLHLPFPSACLLFLPFPLPSHATFPLPFPFPFPSLPLHYLRTRGSPPHIWTLQPSLPRPLSVYIFMCTLKLPSPLSPPLDVFAYSTVLAFLESREWSSRPLHCAGKLLSLTL